VSIAYFKADLLSRHLPERIYRNYGNPGRYFSWELKKNMFFLKKAKSKLSSCPCCSLLHTHSHTHTYAHTNTNTRTQTRARTHTHKHARVKWHFVNRRFKSTGISVRYKHTELPVSTNQLCIHKYTLHTVPHIYAFFFQIAWSSSIMAQCGPKHVADKL
jgi:hypothetical protein